MDILQEREKTSRLNADREESTKILKEMVDLTNTTEETVEVIRQMVRKKGQLKDALISMIYYAYERYLPLSPIDLAPHSYEQALLIDINHAYTKEESITEQVNKNEFLEFLVLLLTSVVEGRIYMEQLRIFLTDAIKQIYASTGNMKKALSYMYPVHVETFSSIPMRKILLYQLEQLRISILAHEYDKAILVAQRISIKQLETEPDLVDYHLNRMLFIHIHKNQYDKIADIFNTLRIKDEKESKSQSIYPALAILFCILDIHNPSSKKLLYTNISSKLCYNEARVLGEQFMNNLLITDSVYALLHSIQEKYSIHRILEQYTSTIKERVIQYNIIVISKYYSRIQIDRIVQILKIEKEIFTEVIVEMVRNKMVTGRICQIESIVEFKKENKSIENWNQSINASLEAVIKITHSMNTL